MFDPINLKLIPAIQKYVEPFSLKGFFDINALEDGAFANYGWPNDKLPDFKEFKNRSQIIKSIQAPVSENEIIEEDASIKVKNSEEIITNKDRQNYIKLVAGLLFFIQGHLDGAKHPNYPKSEAALIRLLEKKLERVPGANGRFFKNAFRDAKKLMSYALTVEQIHAIQQKEKNDLSDQLDKPDEQ